jgi:hypothetical protein
VLIPQIRIVKESSCDEEIPNSIVPELDPLYRRTVQPTDGAFHQQPPSQKER